MDPITLAFAGISAIGQIAAGQAEKEAANLNAFQIRTDKTLNKAQALQMSRSRRAEYDSATAANIGAFYAAGRDVDSDRSVQAFLKKQKEVAGQDIGRIARQENIQGIKAELASMGERRRGRNALTASLFSAAGTMGEGYHRYSSTKSKKSNIIE